MKNLILPALVLTTSLSGCSLYRKATKTLLPTFFGQAPATANVPAGYPSVHRIAIDMSSHHKDRLAAASAGGSSLRHAALAVESKIRKVLTAHGFEVLDRDEMERMHEEAEFLPNDSTHSTQEAFYESLDVEAVLFWDSGHSDPAVRRSSDGSVSSYADVRVDLTLKSTGRIQGEAVASAEGIASWMGSQLNTAEIIEIMGVCAESSAAALGNALRDRQLQE